MGFFLADKWNIIKTKRQINKLSRKFFYKTFNGSREHLEFGNLRKSEEWGIEKDGFIRWVILIDIILERPIHYIISYSLEKKMFSCYAATARHNFSNVFQFSTSDLKELEYRLIELANHIPSLRERMLREYIYNEWKKAPGRKWYNFFTGKAKIEEYLASKIENLYNNKKITKNELERIQAYAANLL
jgi:hypothetical protein